ncbi:MAG: hypothetical protein M1828_003373 [Chrysothrix sp. TS-e1954]|nr:MAG: hypothetical protein M1828_003373 [Chrysothrix sp. TS-e1954]
MDVKKIAVIGAGSMGSMMACLFAEHGCQVTINDPSEASRKAALSAAKTAGFEKQISAAATYEDLCKGLASPQVFVLSLPHGKIPDMVLDGLMPHLEKGDVVIDASNEHWERTERRQGRLAKMGAHFVGCGVSGGYQSARSGPSMCPSASDEALDAVMPFFRKVAAKDAEGNPCVARIGYGGAGNYVKMMHNGIEQGMLCGLAEVWSIMHRGMGMTYPEIGDVFEAWSKTGELRDNFLLDIGADICRQKDHQDGEYVLSKIKDKVVQDADDSEGTMYWSVETATDLHVPIPTIAASHNFRIASAEAQQRHEMQHAVGSALGSTTPWHVTAENKAALLESLRLATYSVFLASFIQGLRVIAKANQTNKWNVSFPSVIKIWRGGCIIRSGAISSLLLPIYEASNTANIATDPTITAELRKTYAPLKEVVLRATENDAVVPTLSANLEYLKYSTTAQDLPTMFEEAQMDYFGKHMFDLRSDPPGEPVTGKHHFEWKPPKGLESMVEELST